MYPISFIGKKQIKTEHFCESHKLRLTRQEAWESMLRLLVFPGTLLNTVESLHAWGVAHFLFVLGSGSNRAGRLGWMEWCFRYWDWKGTGELNKPVLTTVKHCSPQLGSKACA